MKRKDPFIPYLLAAIVIAFAPHVMRLPVWITLWCILCWSWALGAAFGWLQWPGKPVRILLTVIGITVALMPYGVSFNREAGVALLSVMVGLKSLEIRSHRDRMMTVFFVYFLVITNLLYSNALSMLLYLFISVGATTAVLIRMNHPSGNFVDQLNTAGVILIKALPLTAVLFVLFPRVQGSLWSFPKASVGTAGFSEQIYPGAVSELVKNSGIAFRAIFNGKPPAADNLYWRGIVFSRFDGIKWTADRDLRSPAPPVFGTDPVEYTVEIEPHGSRFLFALDIPAMRPPGTRLLKGHILEAARPVKTAFRFTAISYIVYNTGSPESGFSTYLDLPVSVGPMALSLAQRWRDEADNPSDIVEKALSFFRDNDFLYTLSPPLLEGDTIDDFLFRTRKGYCEHYASALAFLMRGAGIPARVVGGYQGGELNPFGDYLIVRQSDAHAWVEVNLRGRGWVRVDPTSVVAPERIQDGPAAALTSDEISRSLFWLRFGPLSPTVKQIMLGWDAANTIWKNRIIDYSANRQNKLLARFGIDTTSVVGKIKSVGIGILVIGALSLLWILRPVHRTKGTSDPVLATYLKFCRKLEHCRLPRSPGQGPLDYLGTVSSLRPDLSDRMEEIVRLYIRLRYACRGRSGDEQRFQALVKRFRPDPIEIEAGLS